MADLDTFKSELDSDINNAINNKQFRAVGGYLILRAAIAAIQQTAGTVTIAPVVITSVTETTPVVTTSSSTILAANPNRKDALIINTSAVDIYLSRGGTAVIGKGIVLKAATNGNSGSAYEINSSNLFKGDIRAIAASSTSPLVSEGV